MPSPAGSKLVYIPKRLANILSDQDFRVLLTRLGRFMRKYCNWDDIGQMFLDDNPEFNAVITKLMEWDEENAIQAD